MIIAGLQKLTLLDYPGKIACIVFTQGCNFACGYCHNPEMIPIIQETSSGLTEKGVLKFLESRRNLLEGVVITGGEPTLQKDLKDFMRQIKDLGFEIKLDTNGSHPGIVQEILQDGLADYVAMDLKATLSKYKDLVKNDVAEQISQTIRVIMDSGVDYEFRSTIFPSCHSEEDIREMGSLIMGSKNWYLQNFRPLKTLHPSFKKQPSFTSEELLRLKSIARQYAEHVEVRS
jgi:pyruvate formate lyase activating enzyme